MIGSLGLTHLLLPGSSVDEHAVASRRASSRSRHWVDASSTSAPFPSTATPAENGRAGLTTSSTAAITTTTRGDRLPIPTDGLRRRRRAADLLAHGDPTQTCRCRAPDSWPSSYEAGQPSRWSTPSCPAGSTRSTCSVHPVRERRRRDRRLRRLGHLTTGAADVQRPTSEPPRIDVQPNSTRDSWTA